MPEKMNSYHEMIIDAASPNFIPHEEINHDEPLNPMAKRLFDMLKAVETLLVEGNDAHSMLSSCAELLYINFKNHWTQKSYDDCHSLEKLDITIETYFEEDSNEDSNEDTDEDSDAKSDNDSDEDFDT
ncbi:hypothetical protein M9H77_18307 [Catharanthus roseus]|uniref:Uncharacterized protein n=1 Tax=Catharanthus roseus TaxID=4058 RepID=A0ACC0B753_CATRO|nr:hypothetical protein M9H77_18307 [Catharanthus roseus]